MVLKSSFLLVVLSLFSFTIPKENEGRMYEQYKSKIEKHINKVFDLDGIVSLKGMEVPKEKFEQYFINHDTNASGYLFLKEVKACSLTGCTASNKNVVTNNVGAEYYDLAVIVDSNFEILNIKVLDYFSDYGYEIASKRYLKQYVGKNICDFSNNSIEVDGISGATISYNALIGSLNDFCAINMNVEASKN